MADGVYVGNKYSDLDIGEKPTKITRVNILVDDEHQYTAGDDTGRTLEKTVPWGSQAMANSILAAVKGLEYQPFTATDALVDPAAEIGDGVTVGGVYSVLAQKEISNGKLTTMQIAAPSTDEIEDEYPYQSRQLRQQSRQIAVTRSMITKTANSIEGKVEAAIDDLVANITFEVTNGTDSSTFSMKIGETTITSPEIKFSSVGEISMEVDNGESSSKLKLTIGGTTIESPAISFTGIVTAASLKDGGTTEIDGSRITTGTISAERLNLSGALTFTDFDTESQNTLNNAASAAGTASTALDNVKALANGTYEQEGVKPEDTFITNKQIYSAEIIGGYVRAAKFTDEKGVGEFFVTDTRDEQVTRFEFGRAEGFDSGLVNSSLTMDVRYGNSAADDMYAKIGWGVDLIIRSEITDGKRSARLVLAGTNILDVKNADNDPSYVVPRTYPGGVWDFRYATVYHFTTSQEPTT